MRIRSWLLGTVIGAIAGLAAAIPMTVADWQANPAGLFRTEDGTNWDVVTETAFTWFWPVALIALVATAVVHTWLCRHRLR